MEKEIINKILLNENNELTLHLESGGDAMYQYVYREAAGVYWDKNQKGFKSTDLKEWTIAEWFYHIKTVVRESLAIDLIICEDVIWENIPLHEQSKIKEAG